MGTRLTRLNDLILGRKLIDGRWRLSPRHELTYRRRGSEEEAAVTGDLIRALPQALVVRISEEASRGEPVQRDLTLRGRWQADRWNRLTFLAERSRGRVDRLTLTGGWAVNEQHEIFYRFKRHGPRTLTFQGHWDLPEDKRLTYLLDRAADSAFRFRGTFQTSSILAKEGEIRYQVGVGAELRRRLKTITLFGKWKLSDRLALSLEVPYARGVSRTMTFGASYRLSPRREISAELKTKEGKPLGVEIIFTQQFLKQDGEGFLRLKKASEETAVEGGIRLRW
ncbi:MAG: hypothetical protein HYS41_05440 [Candidatus Omnitrophica bacterium]|nr:hypothetical protein [Candidatus Omnitrophota bacterium]